LFGFIQSAFIALAIDKQPDFTVIDDLLSSHHFLKVISVKMIIVIYLLAVDI